MKKLIVRDLGECKACYGEGSYELMSLGSDNEPRYQTVKCDHSEVDNTIVQVNVMTRFERMNTIIRTIRAKFDGDRDFTNLNTGTPSRAFAY